MARPRSPKAPPRRYSWHRRPEAVRPVGGCQRVTDTCESLVDALSWLGGEGRDPSTAAERRAEALLQANAGVLRDFHIEADVRRHAMRPVIALRTAARVGALPLRSPVTGRPDFGLLVEPRFAWSSIGDVLTQTGFRVVPRLLPYPELPQSDRRIPPWVLSSIVLVRLRRLLDRLARRFTVVEADRPAPKGTVDWPVYATRRLPAGTPQRVPCRFPDLRNDEELRAAVHYVLREHHGSLRAQRAGGLVVYRLLALCEELLQRVAGTPPQRPRERQLESWRRSPLPSRIFAEGLQAIHWTLEERGLAGLSELAGLSWQLDMEAFFEAWVETLGAVVARRAGATMRTGRQGQTRVALDWRPPYLGSQRALIPDVVIQRADATLILDAKYKAHAEEIQFTGWGSVEDTIRERHRADLLQVLAYSTMFDTPRIMACLVYPCQPELFQSLRERNQVLLRAAIPAGSRQVELALATAPFNTDASETVAALEKMFQTPS
ncbi:MAG TPA: hypothetical protein PLN26_15775 [Acidobacteriota bacterium]|nr:hypothetical protein [Acidobacteriota bacterium]HQG92970.1 hypothetical protein [Acidobacteriota bacterium]